MPNRSAVNRLGGPVYRFSIVSVLAVVALLLASCGGDSHGGDPKGPYGAFSETTEFSYGASLGAAYPSVPLSVGVVGQKEYGGVTYDQHQIAMVGMEETVQTNIIMNVSDDDFQVIAADMDLGAVGAVLGVPHLEFELDEPMDTTIHPPEGETIHVEASGDFVLGNPTEAESHHNETVVIDYETVDNDASLETSLGVLHGVQQVEAVALLGGETINGQIWLHPELGVLKLVVDYPAPDGMTLDMTATADYGDPAAEWNAVKQLVVLAGANGSTTLSTYDANGIFDADKDTHAKMLLELRWADDDLAKTDQQPAYPGVNIEFGTVFGMYPHMLIQSSASFFHPEENGEGYVFWYAYVDQAAKNETENGIAYHITVSADTSITPALRVTSRIVYKRVSE